MSQIGSFRQVRGEYKKHIWNHHLVSIPSPNWASSNTTTTFTNPTQHLTNYTNHPIHPIPKYRGWLYYQPKQNQALLFFGSHPSRMTIDLASSFIPHLENGTAQPSGTSARSRTSCKVFCTAPWMACCPQVGSTTSGLCFDIIPGWWWFRNPVNSPV